MQHDAALQHDATSQLHRSSKIANETFSNIVIAQVCREGQRPAATQTPADTARYKQMAMIDNI
jgi:hypothetical protein